MLFVTKPWRLNIEDKLVISKERFCPRHWWPHKLPLVTKSIIDEPCHFHNSSWRIFHHKIYCRLLKCPNYRFMIQKYKELDQK